MSYPKKTTFQDLVEGLEFETEEQYFDYVMTSKTNGQYKQVRELLKNIKSFGKREDFFKYVREVYGDSAALELFPFVTGEAKR